MPVNARSDSPSEPADRAPQTGPEPETQTEATERSLHPLSQFEAALTGARTWLWSCDLKLDNWAMMGPWLELLGGRERPLQLWDLKLLLSDDELDVVRRSLNQMARDAEDDAETARAIVVRALDGRRFFFKGRWVKSAQRLTGRLSDITEDISLLRMALNQSALNQSALGHTPVRENLRKSTLIHDVRIDPLTGLYNRQGFLHATRAMLRRDGAFDMVIGDIDRFRRLNEALGHERADLVLAILAKRLADEFPKEALLARLGEDEYAVLTQRGFPRVSERMRTALERPISIAGFDIHPTLSMGALTVEGDEKALDPAELLRRAEMAVDAAKTKGAGAVAAYKRELESDGLTSLALEAELRRAFVAGEIEAHFQPIMNLYNGRLAGFEALARWRHARRGLIAPELFLGSVRDMGLLGDLGTLMLSQTVDRLKVWLETYDLPAPFFISVNLSAAEIERSSLVEDVTGVLTRAGLRRKCLKFEVTESDVMKNPEESAKVLEALRKGGIGIALDDFGTGYSSLSHLAKLPIDTLKIDRSFISTMLNEKASAKIVRSILTLGRDLGIGVVAEGIEKREQAEHLSSLGCSFGQGYAYARPLAPSDAEAFIRNAVKARVVRA